MKLSHSVNLFFFIAFTIHMIFISYKQKYPEDPSVKIYKRQLNDIVFPITLKFCMKELKNSSMRYRKYGYLNVWPFFVGQKKGGGKFFGWNGHAQNGSTIGTVQGITGLLIKKKSFFFLFRCAKWYFI